MTPQPFSLFGLPLNDLVSLLTIDAVGYASLWLFKAYIVPASTNLCRTSLWLSGKPSFKRILTNFEKCFPYFDWSLPGTSSPVFCRPRPSCRLGHFDWQHEFVWTWSPKHPLPLLKRWRRLNLQAEKPPPLLFIKVLKTTWAVVAAWNSPCKSERCQPRKRLQRRREISI